jgi:hypothetical protein|tara:strand:+ start:4368 stop:4862 length:495 start_codon:yes stop_codon:yes gene_type:complete
MERTFINKTPFFYYMSGIKPKVIRNVAGGVLLTLIGSTLINCASMPKKEELLSDSEQRDIEKALVLSTGVQLGYGVDIQQVFNVAQAIYRGAVIRFNYENPINIENNDWNTTTREHIYWGDRDFNFEAEAFLINGVKRITKGDNVITYDELEATAQEIRTLFIQ